MPRGRCGGTGRDAGAGFVNGAAGRGTDRGPDAGVGDGGAARGLKEKLGASMTDCVSALDVGLSGSLSVIAFSRGGPDSCLSASDMLLYTWFATFSCQTRISLSGFIGRAS